MPAGSRVRSNNVFGLVTDNPLGVASTTLNSNGLANLPAITLGTQHAVVTLDPLRVNGAPEIIIVSQHSTLATVATIIRGVSGTTARSHPQGTLWTHTPINEDYASVVTSTTRPADPYTGEIIYETDTGAFKYWNGLGWISLGGGGGGATLGFVENFGGGFAFTTITDIPGGTVTINVPAGRRIKISGHSHLSSTVATDRLNLAIREGSTTLNGSYHNVIAANRGDDCYVETVVSPTAGLHTYKLSAERDAGTGTCNVFSTPGVSTTYLLVEDITDSQSPFAAQNVPMGQLAYSQATSNQTGITTEVDITGLSVNVVVTAGRVIRITGFVPAFSTTVSGDGGRISIKEGGTLLTLGQAFIGGTSASAGSNSIMPQVVLSPTAGSHTYKLTAARVSGTGTFTMNADPTFPAYILVEDITPTPTPASTAPSSTLAYAEVTANQSGITAETDLTNLAVTVTVVDGRRLRISTRANVQSTVADDRFSIRIKEGATLLNTADEVLRVATQDVTFVADAVISPVAGTHTYKLTLLRLNGTGSGTLTAGSTFPSFILVEDITGSGISGHTHSQLDDTGWITPTLLNGWVDYDPVNYATAQYRKIGNVVQIKGLVKNGTTNADIFILPVGFRPTRNLHFATAQNGLFGILEITQTAGTAGAVKHNTGSNVWFSLETSFAVN